MVSTLVNIPGYRINEELYNGSRTLVYQGYRESDSLPVVIKLLKNPYPSFSELVQFRNQYTIAKNLNSPLIVQTYNLEPYHNGYALVMEDFGGISLKDWRIRERRQSLQEFLEIAIALCNTLDILYHARIIHKDVKPANILINPETKQVKLIDFSIASLLPRETQTLVNPNVLEGTLAYISPEQTGRMNRLIDYRTDFYSLGVTFYELLTGELPFASNNTMELVHSHIAKTAPLVHEINSEIPSVISEIVNKLMGKNAEYRYQSALGLKFDLENCLQQLEATGEIKYFEIAQRDLCDRFIIPDKLYGRETEVESLLQAFERVSLGATEMMLVAGFSGIGKTAVVNEVHKPIVRQRGYFIKGKFDQFQRNIPFSAFVQAFRDLIGQLLTESDTQIQQWKSQILETLGENGQVILEVIPELERIIGKQSSATQLSGKALENRFNLLFKKFIQVFTHAEHPLVIFLDDLQWADSGSLKLIQLLMTDTGHLLLIGAYRDNEVNAVHPLMLTLGEIRKNSVNINTINLALLNQVQVNQLVADTLKCPENLAWSLSQLVFQKTQGNPFFASQFLKALHQDGLIQFNIIEGGWQCDIAQIHQQAVTDDVVAFMAFQLEKLPQSTKHLLQLAACIGNQFDLKTLAIISENSEVETATCLWNALQTGLITPQNEAYKLYFGAEQQTITVKNYDIVYKFLHDRVQQAAYSLIPETERAIAHYQIGQLLLTQISPEAREEQIFTLVNQLNYGVALIENQAKRHELAQLNLLACRKAKAATAYQAAREYVEIGLNLLGSNTWQTQYEMTLILHELGAEIASLCGDFDQMNQWIEAVICHAITPLERVGVHIVKIQTLSSQNQFLEAISLAQSILQEFGVKFPDSPSFDDIQQAIQEINALMANRLIAEFFDLPAMVDSEKLATMQIAASILPACHLVGSPLYVLVIALQVRLSLEYGNSPTSAFSYSMYGATIVTLLQDITATQWGRLAYRLASQADAKYIRPATFAVVGLSSHHYTSHLQETLPIFQAGYEAALETGNLEYVGYNAHGFCLSSYCCGQPLAELVLQIDAYHQQLLDFKQLAVANYCAIYWETTLFLLGNPEQKQLLFEQSAYEKELVAQALATNNLMQLFTFYICRAIVKFLMGDIDLANADVVRARKYIAGGAGAIIQVVDFYDSLIALATVAESETELAGQQQRVQENQAKLQFWAHHAPMNYQHKLDLVEAEKCRVLGHKVAAVEFYDKAIALAKANEYIQEEALANELAAKFYLDWGKQRIAAEYMTNAYYAYARWGAKAKVADLEKRYPQLLAPILQQIRSPFSTNETIFALSSVTSTSSPTSSSSSVSDILDLQAILKASQTISGEIELEKLLSSLLSLVIENAGADKCVLMLLRDDSLRDTKGERLLIKGSITAGTQPIVLQRIPVEESQDIPHKLIYKVKHNNQTVVLLDATADPILANDPYIVRQQPKSILCSPILHQGKFIGILYLENNLATGVFTSDRVELLNLLCTQAAISLENARLYERSQNYAQQLERSLDELNTTQSRFYNLVDNVPGVVYQFRIAADGTMTMPYISADCYNLYEITAEQAMANVQLILERIHSEDAAGYQQSIVESMQTLNPWRWEGRIVTLSGIIKWMHGEARIVQQADGSLVWDGVLLDISERKIAELVLQQKSDELEQALTLLQNAQLQIVQSEKMSALGNLVAGVAHEMNNPLGFIAASLKQAKPTIADISEHLKLYRESFTNPGEEITEHAEEIDLEYSLSDLPKIIDSMTIACDRLKNISTSLRTFSRADKDYKVPFNIHEGIDSTILILKHRLKANPERPAIEVITEYGNLPQIECFPGQLNQVFMNILANAIDALDESNTGRSFEKIQINPNQIKIKTSKENEGVKITITDNGKGMTEEVKQKIFDHLFTTKGVGKGTGLGLAIARQIVEETHSGKLSCNSVISKGTEFIIAIPV
ncbi:AAA family ATPase [Nostoc sp. ChiQUE01b]|uniref:trifunctional serine/threonine-protein kinase/ATP-binding protein/sensor histidine kinase n=1 Tax=Nostoc sp. ChiQUE01b TaxID=3075376 RepID=UPI002AD5073C|nr:AAA family ATPase [Nostoc sp. ChiQUE01b]MDZ8262652.1 AAA family ATPase [Nostoc sp. ChiQUE01b]